MAKGPGPRGGTWVLELEALTPWLAIRSGSVPSQAVLVLLCTSVGIIAAGLGGTSNSAFLWLDAPGCESRKVLCSRLLSGSAQLFNLRLHHCK